MAPPNTNTGQTKHTKLLPGHHTGKLRPHRHTSYGALALVLLLTLLPLLAVSHSVAADDAYQTYAVVPDTVSKTPPSISDPADGKVYTSSDPVTVRGQCPDKALVKIFKNDVMGGAVLCRGGAFAVPIDLFVGSNSLIARAYNANDIAGPDSAPVSVSLRLPGVDAQGSGQLNMPASPANQFYVTAEISHRGAEAGDSVTWPLTLAGGQPPYAVSVSWGDGKTDLLSRGAAGRFDLSHVYAKPAGGRGNYTIVIRATDQAGTKSYLQLVAIVSGDSQPAGLAGVVGGGYGASTTIRLAWQLLAVVSLAVFSFWIGEKREARLLRRQTARAGLA